MELEKNRKSTSVKIGVVILSTVCILNMVLIYNSIFSKEDNFNDNDLKEVIKLYEENDNKLVIGFENVSEELSYDYKNDPDDIFKLAIEQKNLIKSLKVNTFMNIENDTYNKLLGEYNCDTAINDIIINNIVKNNREMILKGLEEKSTLKSEMKDLCKELYSNKQNNELGSEGKIISGHWINIADEEEYYFHKEKFTAVKDKKQEEYYYTITKADDIVYEMDIYKDDKRKEKVKEYKLLFNGNKSHIVIKNNENDNIIKWNKVDDKKNYKLK